MFPTISIKYRIAYQLKTGKISNLRCTKNKTLFKKTERMSLKLDKKTPVRHTVINLAILTHVSAAY